MKKAIFCIFLCLLTAILACQHDKPTVDVTISDTLATRTQKIDTVPEIVARVKQQSRLYTTEYKVHKVILYNDEATIGGKVIDISLPGHRKAAIPIDVTLKGYVDFSDFSASNVHINDSLCIITLPDPKVTITSSKVDHEAVRQYVSMTRSKFTDADISRLAAQGEDSIASHIASFGIEERSREACARTLVPMLTAMGFHDKNVIIRFRKSFSNSELLPIENSKQ